MPQLKKFVVMPFDNRSDFGDLASTVGPVQRKVDRRQPELRTATREAAGAALTLAESSGPRRFEGALWLDYPPLYNA